jgi:hypothetical protein
MSEHNDDLAAMPEPPAVPFGAADVPAPVQEQIGRGIFFALAAVIGGVVLTVVIWRLGFIASITSFVMAGGAVYLYDRGAKTWPRKGLVPLILLILVGVVASFFAVIASDAWDAYDKFVIPGAQSRTSFITDNIFRGEVLKEYGKDMAMFAVFAVLGVYSTMRRLIASRS